MKLTIDDVRSRFIEHFDGTTGSVYASPGLSTSSVNTLIIMTDLYSPVLFNKV